MLPQGTWFFQNLPFIIAGITGLGSVIAFHELGHFIFCKLFNVHVPTFSIGFGPQIIKKKWGETTFTLSLIPIGGYVEAEMGQTESISKDRYMDSKPYWQKMFIACGGIFFNLIFGFVILFGLSLSGIPANPFLIHNGSYTIKKIMLDSPAQKAHLESGDELLTINGISVTGHINKLFEALAPLAEKEAIITFKRNGIEQSTSTIIGSRDTKGKTQGILGIEEFSFPSLAPISFVGAIKQSFKLTLELINATVTGLMQAFKKKSTQNLAGPLMMISLTIASAGQGIKLFLIFLTLISITLAVINVIPLPILDGGRIFTYTLEAIIQRPLPEQFNVGMHYFSWILMIFLFVYLTIKDLGNLFF